MNKKIVLFLTSCAMVGSTQSYRTQDLHSQYSNKTNHAKNMISEKQQKIDSLNNDIEAIKGKLNTLKKQCPKNPITCLPSSLGMATEEANIKAKQLEIDNLNRDIQKIKEEFPSLN